MSKIILTSIIKLRSLKFTLQSLSQGQDMPGSPVKWTAIAVSSTEPAEVIQLKHWTR